MGIYRIEVSSKQGNADNKKKVKVAQSYPTLCDPMDCSPPGSSVHGIPQARILEWVATCIGKRVLYH